MFRSDNFAAHRIRFVYGVLQNSFRSRGHILNRDIAFYSSADIFDNLFFDRVGSYSRFVKSIFCDGVVNSAKTEQQMFGSDITVTELCGGGNRLFYYGVCFCREIAEYHHNKSLLNVRRSLFSKSPLLPHHGFFRPRRRR